MPTLTFLKPQPKQVEFFKAKAKFILYGGAKGGGKSWSARNKAVRLACRYDGINILLIRRTFAEVYENQIQFLEQDLKPCLDAKGSTRIIHDKQHHVFTFPNGSRIKYGYCADERDLKQYSGQSYDIIIIDEATQFLEEVFRELAACLRGNVDFPKRVYLTANPGGVGHQWVKRLFIDRKFSEEVDDEGNRLEDPDDYIFISAKYTDNKFNGVDYGKTLNGYSDDKRSALRDGNWDTCFGQYFPEWVDADLEVDRFSKIPDNWLLSMSIDYGLDMFAPIWYATNEVGLTFIIKGLQVKDCIVSKAAQLIHETEENLGISDRRIRRLAPPDLWNRTGQTGRCTIDLFAECGLSFQRSDNNRESGWLAIKEMLEDHSLRIFRGAAPDLCRCMRLLQYDETKLNDVCNIPHDITHSPDSLRYFAIMRTRKANFVRVERKENHFTHDIEEKRNNRRLYVNPKVFKGGWNGC